MPILIATAVVTVMTNIGFKHFAKENGINIAETGVGDRYVLEEMLKNGYNSKNLENQKLKDDSSAVALQINIPEAKENLSNRIDKSRKRMYWSYGGLILSFNCRILKSCSPPK